LRSACRDALYPRRHQSLKRAPFTPNRSSFPPRAVPSWSRPSTILVAAKADEVEKSTKIQIPPDGDDRVIIDDTKPAHLVKPKISIDTTDKAFAVIQRFKDRPDTLLRGVQILIGEGETAAQIRFNDRALTAAAIEAAIGGIRAALGDPQGAVQVLIKGGVRCGDGYALKEFAAIAGVDLAAGDVVQDSTG
jgi:hypothetical protein